jgi:hypothetical protein
VKRILMSGVQHVLRAMRCLSRRSPRRPRSRSRVGRPEHRGHPRRAGSSGSRSTPPWGPRTTTCRSHHPSRSVLGLPPGRRAGSRWRRRIPSRGCPRSRGRIYVAGHDVLHALEPGPGQSSCARHLFPPTCSSCFDGRPGICRRRSSPHRSGSCRGRTLSSFPTALLHRHWHLEKLTYR